MNVDEKIGLIGSNAVEIIKDDEIKGLLSEKDCPRVYVGYEPSGKIHLGHMISVNKLIDLQRAGFKVVVLLADLHAYLNDKGTMEEIGEIARFNRECFIGMGLDPEKTEFVLGSEVQLTKEYFMNVHKMALVTTLLRARRSMDMVSKEDDNPKVARVIYPLMQVIDMIALDIDVAVGGIDQRKIHMLARDNLSKLGYAPPICIHLPIIHGIDGDEKMSSSKENFIAVDDSEEVIRSKVKKAFCPMETVDGNPILEIFENHIFNRIGEVVIERPEKFGGDLRFESYKQLEDVYKKGDLHPQDLKNSAADYLVEILGPVREYLISKGY
ncbi:MAG: tyrosine--tRNA ligase [Candidatus Hydrothermarchaeales archaeon]